MAAAPSLPGDGPPDDGLSPPGVIALTLGGLLLLAVAALPALWRSRARARRLSADGPAAPLAAWEELTDTARDLGISPGGSLTPRRTADHLIEVAALSPRPAEAVRRVAGAVEEALYAAHPRPAPQVTDDVRLIRTALRTQASRTTRWRATLLPRSADRLLRTFTTRWRTFRRRISSRTTALRLGGRRT